MKNIFRISCFVFCPLLGLAQSVTIEPSLASTSSSNVEIIGVNGSATPLKLFSNNYYNYLRFYTAGGQEQGSIVAESGVIGLNGLGKTTLNVNNSPRLTVNANGNVGIGNNYDGDTYKLSVKSNSGSIASFLNEDPNGMINVNYNDKHFLQVSATEAIYYGNVAIAFQASNAINFETGLISRLFIGGNSGNVGVGTKTPTAKLEVDGYTKLGSDAPAIKMKKMAFETPATQGGTRTLQTNVIASQILAIQVMIEYATGFYISNNNTSAAGYSVDWSSYTNADGTCALVFTNKAGNSSQILTKPMKILITYEE